MVTLDSRFGATDHGSALPLLAADALRKIARDETLKSRVESDPELFKLFKRAADRYIGGTTLAECVATVRTINRSGHAATADYMGESARHEDFAAAETRRFVELIEVIAAEDLDCTISLDLSHIGLVIDPQLGIANARVIASAARRIGREVVISMEGSERTDAILAAHASLCREFDHVGITLQARMKRTDDDLAAALDRPGKIRLVKGAYDEPLSIAHARTSPELGEAYRRHAATLISSGHACSIATHDTELLAWIDRRIDARDGRDRNVEFETLYGLGPEQSSRMKTLGHPTRQYVVYGREWFLYVCHRIAEAPERVYLALADVVGIRHEH